MGRDLVLLLDRIFLVGFDRDLDLRTLLEGNLFAVLVFQDIINANLPVEMFGALNTDLCLSGTRGSGDLMIFSTVPGKVVLGFSS